MTQTNGGRRIERVLIGVDDTQSTRAAIDHVVGMFASSSERPQIILLHVIDHPAPTGYEAAASAMALDAGAMPALPVAFEPEDIDMWKDRAKKKMEPFVDALNDAGWDEKRIERHAAIGGLTHAAVADVLAEQAKQLHADVVVVGRSKHGMLHEALLKSTGERLVHYCRGMTVWVVGNPEHAKSEE
ncbi:MAG: universal stress protein [Phycisphaerales bacterium]